MKILVISDAWHPQINGVVRTYEYLREELIKRGHDVKIVGPSDFQVTVPLPGYPEIRIAVLPGRRLKRKIESFAPDHIHIATEGPLGYSAWNYCVKNHIRFSTAYHTQFPEYLAERAAKISKRLYEPVFSFILSRIRKFHARSSVIFVATQSLEDTLKSRGFQSPMSRLTRGVDFNIFNPNGPKIFQHYKKPVALYVGRIALEKNLEDFLKMDWPGSKVLIGQGPSLSALQRCYPDAVFKGKKTGEDLAAYYCSSDVFVFPSQTDTFGMVLIEALACGLPVAAYPVTGPVDIITDKNLGVLDNNLESAAKKSLEGGDPNWRFQYVRSHYSWDKAADQFIEGIEQTL